MSRISAQKSDNEIQREQLAKERGERLKQAIRRLGLTQVKVAKDLEMSLSGFTYLLSGRSLITPTIAYAMEFKYNIGSDWILSGRGFLKPELRLRLDPWERLILELLNRKFDEEYLNRILTVFEWSERGNDVLLHAEFSYTEGKISPDEHAEITASIRKPLNELQVERRNVFEELKQGLTWETKKDFEGETRMTRRMRELWKKLQPNKYVDPEGGGGSILLEHFCRSLIMFLHFGEAEWNRIKENSIDHRRRVADKDPFYLLALEALQEVQSEISELITATPEQLRFIEEAEPRHRD